MLNKLCQYGILYMRTAMVYLRIPSGQVGCVWLAFLLKYKKIAKNCNNQILDPVYYRSQVK